MGELGSDESWVMKGAKWEELKASHTYLAVGERADASLEEAHTQLLGLVSCIMSHATAE